MSNPFLIGLAAGLLAAFAITCSLALFAPKTLLWYERWLLQKLFGWTPK